MSKSDIIVMKKIKIHRFKDKCDKSIAQAKKKKNSELILEIICWDPIAYK